MGCFGLGWTLDATEDTPTVQGSGSSRALTFGSRAFPGLPTSPASESDSALSWTQMLLETNGLTLPGVGYLLF